MNEFTYNRLNGTLKCTHYNQLLNVYRLKLYELIIRYIDVSINADLTVVRRWGYGYRCFDLHQEKNRLIESANLPLERTTNDHSNKLLLISWLYMQGVLYILHTRHTHIRSVPSATYIPVCEIIRSA